MAPHRTNDCETGTMSMNRIQRTIRGHLRVREGSCSPMRCLGNFGAHEAPMGPAGFPLILLDMVNRGEHGREYDEGVAGKTMRLNSIWHVIVRYEVVSFGIMP